MSAKDWTSSAWLVQSYLYCLSSANVGCLTGYWSCIVEECLMFSLFSRSFEISKSFSSNQCWCSFHQTSVGPPKTQQCLSRKSLVLTSPDPLNWTGLHLNGCRYCGLILAFSNLASSWRHSVLIIVCVCVCVITLQAQCAGWVCLSVQHHAPKCSLCHSIILSVFFRSKHSQWDSNVWSEGNRDVSVW